MKAKLKNFYGKHKIYILSATIPTLLMLIIFIIGGIYPFGDRSFLHIDMYHQYFPFLTEMYHKIKDGEGLFYSFRTGIGSNFLALFVYYLATPFNWLSLLFPEKLLMEFMSYLVILKIGACGFTFSYYLKKHFNSNHLSIVGFSVFYALSGYMAAYNWNVMWLDCIVLAPIILWGLEKLVKGEGSKLYCISLALAILSNYYICIMICIYLVLYFFVLLIQAKQRGKAILRFAWYSLLAGGMAAVLLLPEISALAVAEYSNLNFPKTITSYFSFIDVLARHSFIVPVEIGLNHWPNIYCGVPVLFLLPLYIVKKDVPLKEKLPKVFLLVFFIFSFSINALNFIWHGLNYPNSLPSRQSFLYIILLLTVCFEVVRDIHSFSKKTLAGSFGIVCGFLLLCQQTGNEEQFSLVIFLSTLGILALYGLIVYMLKQHPERKKKLLYAAIALAVFEAGINTLYTSVPTVSRSGYLKKYDDYYTLMDRISATDDSFFRVEKESRVTKNDGMLLGYPSASLFSSTSNVYARRFYDKYGMQTSSVYYNFEGDTPFTAALLSVKYYISDNSFGDLSLYEFADCENLLYMSKSNYCLPFGFYVDMNTADRNPADADSLNALFTDVDTLAKSLEQSAPDDVLTPLVLQNRLFTALTDIHEPLFEPTSIKRVSDSETVIKVEKDGYVYAYKEGNKIKEITAEFADSQRTEDFKKMNNNYIMDLGYHRAGDMIRLTTEDDGSLNVIAYVMNEQLLGKFVDQLSAHAFTAEVFEDDYIKGSIQAETNGELVFTIPYDAGWTLKVDGRETEMHIFENCFISVPLDAGTHTIELSYYPSGLKAGILISCVSLVLFVATTACTKLPIKEKKKSGQ